jgi:hypothetical protein
LDYLLFGLGVSNFGQPGRCINATESQANFIDVSNSHGLGVKLTFDANLAAAEPAIIFKLQGTVFSHDSAEQVAVSVFSALASLTM